MIVKTLRHTLLGVDHPKVSQRILDRHDLLLRTLRHPAALRLGRIIALLLNDAMLLLHLRDVQAAHLQAAVLQHIVLDLPIGGLALRSGDVQLIQLQINIDMLRGIEFGE